MALPTVGMLGYYLPVVDADLAIRQEDRRRAERRLAEAAALVGERELPTIQVLLRLHGSHLALAQGEVRAALSLTQEALAIADRNDTGLSVIDALESLALVLAASGETEEVRRLLGAARAHRDRIGYRSRHAAAIGVDELYAAAAADHLAEGAAFTLDGAVAFATRSRGARRRPPAGWDALTPMEAEVVELAGAGLANREIAERLFISVSTVKTHLVHAYAKLGLTSRAPLVRAVTRRAQPA